MTWGINRRMLITAMVFAGLIPARWMMRGNDETDADGNMLAETVSLRDHGADPTGKRSSVAAFGAALAAGRRVTGAPGDVYLLDASVDVPADRAILGNGGTLRIGTGAIGLRLPGDHCTVQGWTIEGNGGLYAVLNTGKSNRFDKNMCTGDIGHFFFSTGTSDVTATGNVIDGTDAPVEITTGIAVENCTKITISHNRFTNIPVGWGIQIRKQSRDFVVSDNIFLQKIWSDTKKAIGGQRSFTFDIGSRCLLKKIQVNGKPLSIGYTIVGKGPKYTVVFEKGRVDGDTITLVGYRGAENIQINSGSGFGIIRDNSIDGTGDSGIICYGSNLTVVRNNIRRCGYAGIAIYGGQRGITVGDNVIADCAQLDDGLSSPDHPQLASAFAGAILASGDDTRILNNVVTNGGGTMRYAIRINNVGMAMRTDGSAAIAITGNRFEGTFADGAIYAPNQTPGARIHSIMVDGPTISYPGTIDLDQMWVHAPPTTRYVRTSGLGRTWAARDTDVKKVGIASLKTIANEHIDFDLTAASELYGCNVTVSFWAKATGGKSYCSVFTKLAGLLYPLTADISATSWQQYFIRFPFTPDLEDMILIRCGAHSGSANIQQIEISGQRL